MTGSLWLRFSDSFVVSVFVRKRPGGEWEWAAVGKGRGRGDMGDIVQFIFNLSFVLEL